MDNLSKISLIVTIKEFFQNKNNLTATEIKMLLKNKNITISESQLNEILKMLLINYGSVIKKDYWNKESEFIYLPKHLHNSSYTRHYYSFDIDDNNKKSFLLISDTHIGNPNFEDFKLLHNLYDYVINHNIKKCFHLGDLFAGNFNSNTFSFEEVLLYN